MKNQAIWKIAVHFSIVICVVKLPFTCVFAKPRAVNVNDATGMAAATVVENLALAHTMQLLPTDAKGDIAVGDLEGQTVQLLANLEAALKSVGSSTIELARLNVYVANNELAGKVGALLSKNLPDGVHPAVTTVVSRLADERALVAVDAIASVPEGDATKVVRSEQASILPRGSVVYISGMAERFDDLAEATRGTMKQLHGMSAM